VSVTFDGSGAGTSAPLGPQRYGEKWHVDRMVSSTTSDDTQKTKLRVYRNTVTPGSLVDSTNSANSDVSETSLDLVSPDRLIFVFSNGTAGRVGTVTLTGEITRG
jgi:hypothetical protein